MLEDEDRVPSAASAYHASLTEGIPGLKARGEAYSR